MKQDQNSWEKQIEEKRNKRIEIKALPNSPKQKNN